MCIGILIHLLLLLFLVSFACSVPGVIYLSPEIQETLPYTLVKLVPYKSYSRKNIGYLYAIQVTILLDVLDSNISK